jgi:hypothetical protein
MPLSSEYEGKKLPYPEDGGRKSLDTSVYQLQDFTSQKRVALYQKQFCITIYLYVTYRSRSTLSYNGSNNPIKPN